MLVLITYDVSTMDKEGRRRLRRIAKTCLNYGQRVQNSVFECDVDSTQWTFLENNLLNEMKDSEDSLRFYFLGKNWRGKVEHHGTKPTVDLDGALII